MLMDTAPPTPTDDDIRAAFSDGPLGVLVTHTESRPILDDLLAEATKLGIGIEVFFMDEGVRLLTDGAWVAQLPEGHYSACDRSARSRNVAAPDRVSMAGQYHNALMVHDAPHVVSL
jgi:hypothetical protein